MSDGSQPMTGASDPVLVLNDLVKLYPIRGSVIRNILGLEREDSVHAVDRVSLTINRGSIVALVGESGCGKSTLAKLLTMYEKPTEGEYTFLGEPIKTWTDNRSREFRRQVQMVFQDPYKSLDPRFTVGETCVEPLKIQRIGNSDTDRRQMAVEALRFVGLTPAEDYMQRYPSELSGGQRQRVAIARAIVLQPTVIVADEPVSMLDVSLRSGILELLLNWRDTRQATIVFITHDLAIARYISAQVAVMYLGEIVEFGPTEAVISNPKHPYAKALVSAVPVPDPYTQRPRTTLPGDVPNAVNLPKGCRFASRCPVVMERCRDTHPMEYDVGEGRLVRCLNFEDVQAT